MSNMDDITQEGKPMSALRRIIVPPAAFNDPNDPQRAAGSINMPLSSHPAKIPGDYGDRSRGMAVANTLGGSSEKKAGDANDRSTWKKADWKDQAEAYGLHVSGNMDELKQRVEEYEANVKAAGELSTDDWKTEIDGADDVEELDGMRQIFDATGVDNADVVAAFDAKKTELEEASKGGD